MNRGTKEFLAGLTRIEVQLRRIADSLELSRISKVVIDSSFEEHCDSIGDPGLRCPKCNSSSVGIPEYTVRGTYRCNDCWHEWR